MGQKVNPHGLRVGIIKDWDSNWYADKRNDEFAKNLAEDQILRKYLKTTLYKSNISKIEIERSAKNVKIVLYTAKPGVVIGKGGAGIEKIKHGKYKHWQHQRCLHTGTTTVTSQRSCLIYSPAIPDPNKIYSNMRLERRFIFHIFTFQHTTREHITPPFRIFSYLNNSHTA